MGDTGVTGGPMTGRVEGVTLHIHRECVADV